MSVVDVFNGRIVTPAGILNGATIHRDGDRIAAILPLDRSHADAIDLDGGWLVPGFIDTQVNGGGGVLFNDRPSVEGIAAIAAAHAPLSARPHSCRR